MTMLDKNGKKLYLITPNSWILLRSWLLDYYSTTVNLHCSDWLETMTNQGNWLVHARNLN